MKPLSTAHGYNNKSSQRSAYAKKLTEFDFMGQLTLKVFPASKLEKIEIHNHGHDKNSQRSEYEANVADITVRLREKAHDNKANIALLRFLKKLSGYDVWLKTGVTSRIKIIEFDGDKNNFLASLKKSLRSK